MSISNFAFQLVLCLGLLSSSVMAEEFSVPDKERRQGMSFEEYSEYREKMRLRMENTRAQERNPTSESSSHNTDQAVRPNADSAYGQGYRSRNRLEDRPDINSNSRPERPRVEKFNRGEMMRR